MLTEKEIFGIIDEIEKYKREKNLIPYQVTRLNNIIDTLFYVIDPSVKYSNSTDIINLILGKTNERNNKK
jgi:hypothetical protein